MDEPADHEIFENPFQNMKTVIHFPSNDAFVLMRATKTQDVFAVKQCFYSITSLNFKIYSISAKICRRIFTSKLEKRQFFPLNSLNEPIKPPKDNRIQFEETIENVLFENSFKRRR